MDTSGWQRATLIDYASALWKTFANRKFRDWRGGKPYLVQWRADVTLTLLGPMWLGELGQQPLRLRLRQPTSDHRLRYSPLPVELMAFGKLALI